MYALKDIPPEHSEESGSDLVNLGLATLFFFLDPQLLCKLVGSSLSLLTCPWEVVPWRRASGRDQTTCCTQ